MTEDISLSQAATGFLKTFNELMRNSPPVATVPFITIDLTEATIQKYSDWLDSCYAEDVAKQKAEVVNPDFAHTSSWELGFPYHGAIGGGVTFELTGTSLGYVVKATYGPLNKTIDLTEYESW